MTLAKHIFSLSNLIVTYFCQIVTKEADPISSNVIYEWPLAVPCFVSVLLGICVLSICQCVLT